MSLDLTSTGDGGGAASDVPATSAVGTAGLDESTVSDEGAVSTPVETPDSDETTDSEQTAPDDSPDEGDPAPAELTEEELEKLVKDEGTPRQWREKLEQAYKLAGRRKDELAKIQAERDAITKQYEGVEALKPDEVTRLREAEEFRMQLSSPIATPDDVLKTIKAENPRVYNEVLNKVAWEALENEDGSPDFNNIQAFIDRAAPQFGENKVDAKDVWQVIQGLASGNIDPTDLHGFRTLEEMEAYTRQQQMEAQGRKAQELGKRNAEFAEEQVRTQFVSQEQHQIRAQFQQGIDKIRTELKLNVAENEPKWSADFKNDISSDLDVFIGLQAQNNPSLKEAQNILEHLTKVSGADPSVIQQEITSALQSRSYKLRLDKGLSEVRSAVEKYLAKKAVDYSYIAKGREAEAKKKPRAVPRTANQTPESEALSEEEVRALKGDSRIEYEMRQLSNAIRQGKAAPV